MAPINQVRWAFLFKNILKLFSIISSFLQIMPELFIKCIFCVPFFQGVARVWRACSATPCLLPKTVAPHCLVAPATWESLPSGHSMICSSLQWRGWVLLFWDAGGSVPRRGEHGGRAAQRRSPKSVCCRCSLQRFSYPILCLTGLDALQWTCWQTQTTGDGAGGGALPHSLRSAQRKLF